MLKYNATQWFIEEYDKVHNYPINDRLLIQTIKYNNVKAFNHLLNMVLPSQDDNNNMLRQVLKHGNVDMLNLFLGLNAQRTASFSINDLMRAIDTGNVDFVRILLRRGCVDREPSYSYNREDYKFKRSHHGISVTMLKMLHEEFNRLYYSGYWFPGCIIISNDALEHCTRCNLDESVRYIANMPYLSLSSQSVNSSYQMTRV
ncbi:hypothetical protein SAMD00019534_076290 [Acytostelium subglobosum LB1]|uniref:hypothetical protein n=1 Tax=Acytostelium subglobosum LB1 TaxID=1410327 RepID=UPI000644E2A8|nr:hypothetical protein SAMD00019534_076290 [Acytostelium subglobosum LB1]GAM24454.1 hypothetical protein SAMD00019534_076290 [Acytostelium subglobosum LB1]|eukprot:XP_012752780.1 hypothetical protein SAMD00019534_076290 [Acytostelium subglobosum LB1]